MIEPIRKCVAGIDVHKKIVNCTILEENQDGELKRTTREYLTFQENLKQLSNWLYESQVELVIMESTGVYWQCMYETIEEKGILCYVVNAYHMKNVPGRKTDMSDSQWMAELGRCGLLKPSFIPPKEFRELRMLTRYRKKLRNTESSEKNRLHKILELGGIKLGSVVSDIDGVSAREMIAAILNNSPIANIASLARGRLRAKIPSLIKSLRGELTDRHKYLLRTISNHIKWLESTIASIDDQVAGVIKPYQKECELLETIPGIDKISAAMLLGEIGVNMEAFGTKDRISSWAGMCPGNNISANKKKVDVSGVGIHL